jgi:hypothetical protein
MKKTKVMLAIIATFIITLFTVNTIVWYLQDTATFKQSFSHGATIGIMLIVGWIPAIIVGYEVNYKLEQ